MRVLSFTRKMESRRALILLALNRAKRARPLSTTFMKDWWTLVQAGLTLIPSLATEIPTLENGLVSEDRLTYTFPASGKGSYFTTALTSPQKMFFIHGNESSR